MTTIISPAQASGVGIMMQQLATHCRAITKVLAVDNMEGIAGAPLVEWPDRVEVYRIKYGDDAPPECRSPACVWVEGCCGVDVKPWNKRVYIPMWENPATGVEAKNATLVLAVTKWTKFQMDMGGIDSTYVPWPVDTSVDKSRAAGVDVLLHVAGSFGHQDRKGAIDAVKMFQNSRLGHDDRALVIRCWREPSKELREQIAVDPAGIEIEHRFFPDHEALFKDADALLYTAKIEGHALVALEAMARGLPVFATNAAPMNEYEHHPMFLIPVKRYELYEYYHGPIALVDTKAAGQILRHAVQNSAAWVREKRAIMGMMMAQFSWGMMGGMWENLLG